jgi:hypothetical protein
MNRTDALKVAQEHVDKLSTNIRGYQDGVRFPDKVAAVEQFARFLLETGAESDPEPVRGLELTPERAEVLSYVLRKQLDEGPPMYDVAAQALLDELREREHGEPVQPPATARMPGPAWEA